MRPQTTPRARGFALPELGALGIVALLALAIIIPSLNDTRRQAGLGHDIANLRQIGVWTAMYALDNDDRYWNFSWEAGNQSSQWPDLRNPSTNFQAATLQAVDILRRRTGRGSGPTMITPPGSWIPHVFYNYLPLADYLNQTLPDFTYVSTADTFRLLWASDPLAFDQGAFLPFQPQPSNSARRWPYSSSHRFSTSFFDGSPVGSRISQNSVHSFSVPGAAVFGGQRLGDVSFPTNKVHTSFAESRYFNTYQYCTTNGARLPFLMADASVQIHDADDADEGWQPNNPTAPQPTLSTYIPRPWEARTSNGEPEEVVIGRFLWTRDFLAGRDFDHPNRPPKSKRETQRRHSPLAEILHQLVAESQPDDIVTP